MTTHPLPLVSPVALRVALGIALAATAGCARPAPPAASLPAPLASPPEPTADVLREVIPASVQILVERGGAPLRWASGVAIAARPAAAGTECLVLTAGHTLARLGRGDEVFALLDRHRPEPIKARAEVLAAQDDQRWDLALLKIPGGACAAAARAGGAPGLGDPVWVVGFPHGGEMTVGRGIVSQLTRARAGVPPRFTVDASTSHGSSGAGVFDSRTGRLIGLVEAFGTARVPIRGDAASPHVDIPVPGMTYVTPMGRIDEFFHAAVGGRLVVDSR